MIDFTTVVGVDRAHLEELRLVWPTWRANRPELLAAPLLLVCDGDVPDDVWDRELAFVDHPRVRRVAWRQDGVDQREKMLTGLTLVPARCVETPWTLKLDVDAVAYEPSDWLPPRWFESDRAGRPPAFVSSPWGYSKPADVVRRLDDWGDGVAGLREHPRLNLVAPPGAGLLTHPRITSWCFFARTEWLREVVGYLGDRLPVPSQDTYLWYCAARRGDFFRRERMANYGWKHCGRRRTLLNTVEEWRRTQPTRIAPAPRSSWPTSAPSRTPLSATPRAGSEGVLFLLTGAGHAARLAVAAMSLRDHYTGPATLVTTQPESHAIGAALAADTRLALTHRPVSQTYTGKNASYLQKIVAMDEHAPYERTLFLDADVLVVGDLTPLFEPLSTHDLVATQFSGWTSRRGPVRRRIDRWRALSSAPFDGVAWTELLDRAVEKHPAVNTGVLAFRRDAEFLRRWRELALIGRRTFICDEVALQIVLPGLRRRVFDCRWNGSPKYARDVADVRIWHFHGDRHLRDSGRGLWEPAFQRAWRDDVGGVRGWAPAGDDDVSRWIASQKAVDVPVS